MASQASGKPEAGAAGLGGDTHRILVVAAAETAGQELADELRARASDRASQILLVPPAVAESTRDHAMGSVDDDIVEARARLDASVQDLGSSGLRSLRYRGPGDA